MMTKVGDSVPLFVPDVVPYEHFALVMLGGNHGCDVPTQFRGYVTPTFSG